MSKVALAIALLALVGTWGGPAVADGLLNSRDIKNNSLRGKDIRDRSLKGRDLKSNSVTGRVVAGLSGRDLLPESIDGSDIAEETLDVRRARTAERADSAATADTLSGVRLSRVHAALAPSQTANVLDSGGLTLTAACSAASGLSLVAVTTQGPAQIRASGVHRSSNNQPENAFAKDDDFRPGDAFDALAGVSDNLSGQLVYVAPDGGVTTVVFLAEQGLAVPAGTGCLVAGTATHAAG